MFTPFLIYVVLNAFRAHCTYTEQCIHGYHDTVWVETWKVWEQSSCAEWLFTDNHINEDSLQGWSNVHYHGY